MTESEIVHIALFAAGVLLVCAFGLTAAAMFPAEHRPPALRTGWGTLGLYLAVLVAATVAVQVVWFAAAALAWYFAVIAGGIVLLFAPALHQILPGPLRDGAAGILAFGLACLMLAWILLERWPS